MEHISVPVEHLQIHSGWYQSQLTKMVPFLSFAANLKDVDLTSTHTVLSNNEPSIAAGYAHADRIKKLEK